MDNPTHRPTSRVENDLNAVSSSDEEQSPVISNQTKQSVLRAALRIPCIGKRNTLTVTVTVTEATCEVFPSDSPHVPLLRSGELNHCHPRSFILHPRNSYRARMPPPVVGDPESRPSGQRSTHTRREHTCFALALDVGVKPRHVKAVTVAPFPSRILDRRPRRQGEAQ